MINLLHGDCLELMKTIPSGSIDAIITDPPYGTTACKWDSVIPFDLMWDQLNRVIKPNGAIVLFGSEPFSSALRMSNIKNYKYDWIWFKNKPSGALNAKFMPMHNHEIISVFVNNSKPTFNNILEDRDCSSKTKESLKNEKVGKWYGSNTNRNSGEVFNINKNIEKRNATTVKYFKCPPQKSRFHPTQKPVALMEYLIKTYTNDNEIVLDFTAGSFTTAIACMNTKRNFIGIEKDDVYFNIGVERVAKHKIKLEQDLFFVR
jgi:site-specific DNA-methyltransferase (adenine-specific)